MSWARTLTTFVVDISSTMGQKRAVLDDFVDEHGRISQKERTTTNLEWCLDFVSRKAQEIIFCGLKTAQMSIVTFGSPRTLNAVVDADPEIEGYRGVDELARLGQPTVATLELLRSLRAVQEGEGGEHPDPLDALICALTAMGDPDRGGVNPTSKSWKRTIYLITDARHAMNKDSTDAIADRIKEDGVSLRVIGVDFDDEEYGFVEEAKDDIKAENEAWWHNWLQELPDSRIATAAHAIEQATLPAISLQGSAPYATALTFGDPAAQYSSGDTLSVPVKMLKLTTRVLPMARKTLSKLAEQTESAKREKEATQQAMSDVVSQDGVALPTPTPNLPQVDNDEALSNTYRVDQRRLFFFAEEAKEVGTDHAQPLAEGEENKFGQAYKLGASLIPITDDLDVEWQSTVGMEIINWVKQSSFRRNYLLGDVWNVFADSNNLEAQVQLSSLAKAMQLQEKLALVRFVRKQNAEPKLGILYPVVRAEETQAEYFHFAEVPFSEDLKRYTFPSLERVVTADGKELKEHRSLPSERMISTMDKLVESMDLSHAFKGEDGEDEPWFSTEDSFNPAIHRMKDAVAWRVMHPDSKELKRPHWEVDKFLDRPTEIQEASAPWIEECKELFNIRYYPEKGIIKAKEKREREIAARAQAALKRYELDLGGADVDHDPAQGTGAGETQNDEAENPAVDTSQSQKRLKDSQGQSQSIKGKIVAADSDTEEEEEDMLAPARPSQRPQSVKGEVPSQILPSQRSSQTQTQTQRPSAGDQRAEAQDNAEREDADLIPKINLLASDPIGSFDVHMSNHDMDQGEVIRSFQKLIIQLIKANKDESSRLAQKCLTVGRTAAADYDEAREWNRFIRTFKVAILGTRSEEESIDFVSKDVNPSLKAFWNKYCRGRLDIGLVTKEEDEGRRVDVSNEEAQQFVDT
ncbi:unnamed protein product [Sympodiomycopsis kandeliae]